MPDYFLTQELIAEHTPAFTPRLFDHSVLVVGLGGNGCHVALAAVRMGFARVVSIDRDVVAESNLSRQVLYTREDVGRPKAEAAAAALARHNLRSVVEAHHLDVLAEAGLPLAGPRTLPHVAARPALPFPPKRTAASKLPVGR